MPICINIIILHIAQSGLVQIAMCIIYLLHTTCTFTYVTYVFFTSHGAFVYKQTHDFHKFFVAHLARVNISNHSGNVRVFALICTLHRALLSAALLFFCLFQKKFVQDSTFLHELAVFSTCVLLGAFLNFSSFMQFFNFSHLIHTRLEYFNKFLLISTLNICLALCPKWNWMQFWV